jgi:hypothetical protein
MITIAAMTDDPMQELRSDRPGLKQIKIRSQDAKTLSAARILLKSTDRSTKAPGLTESLGKN